MNSTAWHHFDEFLRLLNMPVWRTEVAAEWHDETSRFVLELHEKYFLLSIMVSLPPGDGERVLRILYKRAAPQRFMGLPVRVYKNQDCIMGAIAVPKELATAERLMKLHHALSRMFDLTTL